MSLTPGTRFGAFEITSVLGAGGMGAVYRGRDTRLDRDVAIKVLLDAVAQDPDRVARFEREAKLLASLNHPHIAQIYGFEGSDTASALVMELVEGATLADRIAQGPLPLDEALSIARQITEALEAAHDHGIVHRDLKPANIKVRSDGTVKVLDFGLAKLAEPTPAASAAATAQTMSPTMTSPAMTQVGVILGTAAYMSPEQGRGRAVDKRADIWAFGVILYEMLAGSRPFAGDDITETLASVVKDQPDLARVPVAVRKLLARCLEKDPRTRLRDIGDVWGLLDDAGTTPAMTVAPPAPAWRRRMPWGIAGVFALVSTAIAVVHFGEPATKRTTVVRFQLSAPQQAGNATPSISPDGQHIAYQAGNRIYVRDLDSLTPRLLTTTEAPVATPFWSADSRSVIFGGAGKLMKIDAAGGPPLALCDLASVLLDGFAVDNDTIMFVAPPDGLYVVPSRGGTATAVRKLPGISAGAVAGGQFIDMARRSLPGNRIIYAQQSDNGDSGVYVASLDGNGKPVRVLQDVVSDVDYVPADVDGNEHLLFVRAGTLMAQAFDSRRPQVSGEARVVADRVRGFSASDAGTIVYSDAGEGRRLVWVNRQGVQTATAWAQEPFNELSMSPDGSKVAVVRAVSSPSTWIYDFARESNVKLSTSAATALKPVWSPDSSRVAFASNRGGTFQLYAAPASGTGAEESLLTSALLKYPLSWSRDGRWLLFTTVDPATKEDLWLLPMSGTSERKPEPFLVTNYRETDAAFSPDGRSVAYVSDESGTSEIYVRAFPSGGKRVISSGGGYQPRWRSDGKELLYLSGRGQLMRAEMRPGEATAANPGVLFQAQIYGGGPSINNWYWDVEPGGERMLFNIGSTESGTSLMTVVLNWQAELRR